MGVIAAWLRFVAKRLASAVLAVFGMVALTFVTIRIVANPIDLLAGMDRTPQTVAALTKSLGLDKPLWVQFAIYLQGIVHGDLGVSRQTYLPVTTEIGTRLPATVELMLYATLLAAAAGISLGVLAAARPGSVLDRFTQLLVQLGSSMPPFWVGLLLTFCFFAVLHVAPAPLGRLDPGMPPPRMVTGLLTIDALIRGDWAVLSSAITHLVLPSVTLALVMLPSILQITRTTVMHVLESDFIRCARSVGLPTRQIYLGYALRAALVPIINVLAMAMGWAISGAVLVEVVFGWPGIGYYAVTAMGSADYEPVVGVVLLAATVYVFLYFLADILSAAVDPRISLS